MHSTWSSKYLHLCLQHPDHSFHRRPEDCTSAEYHSRSREETAVEEIDLQVQKKTNLWTLSQKFTSVDDINDCGYSNDDNQDKMNLNMIQVTWQNKSSNLDQFLSKDNKRMNLAQLILYHQNLPLLN